MNILNLENVTKVLGDRTILKNASAGISGHDRIGIIGINGTGKSTLLSLIAGRTEPDEGQIVQGKQLRISCLLQNPVFDHTLSVLENTASAVRGKEAHWDTAGEVRSMLIKLGIPDPDVSPAVLSGGQKKRAALAAALLTPCDLLILDEPTNHLDIEMIEWLQHWLSSYRGALLMVTHDRYFLDEVTDKILEIDHGNIYRYEGNYSEYLRLKEAREASALAAERKMAALYRQDLAWIQRGARARSTKQKAHIQRFEALRDREKLIEERRVVIDSLQTRMGSKTIEIENISKSYGERTLFHGFTYTFLRSDRIGIIGSNGCGKSTLLKILLGLLPPDTGSVTAGQTIRFAYFSQENEALEESAGVLDYIRSAAEYIRTKDGLVSASSMCERFLFDSSLQYTPISRLSGGEKRRLCLLKVLMTAPNVLILDEPTNDLDIQTLQILEDYLDTFAGIVITVSHDRYFLDRVVSRIFAFLPDGTLFQSEGGYEEYLYHMEQLHPSVRSAEEEEKEKKPAGQSDRLRSRNKLSYKDQREYDTLEEEVDSLTARSDALQAEINTAATDYSRLQQLTAEKEEVDSLLEAKIERYLELQELVDSFS